MLSNELAGKIRGLHFKTRHLANDLFAGLYGSAYRGRGIEFSGVRPYEPGDDTRAIDWKVSARFGHPFVKVFEETYRRILLRGRKHCNPRMLLIDPFYISREEDTASFRATVLTEIKKYIAVTHKLASEFGALSVETHKLFAGQLKFYPADTFCPEPVHPNLSGHMVISHGVLKALGW